MVTANYTLTKEDYSNYYIQLAWLTPERKKQTIKNYVYKALLYAVLLTIVKLFDTEHVFDFYFFFSVVFVATIFIMPIFQMEEIYTKQVDKLSNNPLNVNLFKDVQISLAETGIFTKTEFSETQYRWASIVKKEEDRDYYFLYLASDQALLLPKRAFRSESEKQQAEKLFGEHISFNAEVGHLVKE